MHSLRYLSLSYGLIPSESYNYSSSINRKFKGAGFDSDSLSNIILPLLFLSAPLLLGFLFWALSKTVISTVKSFQSYWKYAFGEYALYSYLLIAYYALVACGVAFISLSEGSEPLKYCYIGIGLINCFCLIALNIAMYQSGKWFG